MSKLTVAELKNFGTNYVAAAQQAGAWKNTSDNMYNLLDKVGKQITISNNYSDKLPELDGEELFQKTVEEYFVDLPVIVDGPKNKGLTPEDEEAYASGALRPYLPEVEDVCYSYTLGRKVIPTTIAKNNVERAAINAEAAGTMIADITAKLAGAESLYKYAAKKQLLGNVAKATEGKDHLRVSVGELGAASTTEGEKFIIAIKQAIEDASFAHEGGLNGALIGATDESNLMLVVSKNVMASLDVNVWAGAFNLDKVSFPNITIKVVEDFGDAEGVKAMLIDKRGVRLHPTYRAIRTQENSYFDSVNVFSHMEYTAFYSKYTFVRVFTA